MPVIYKKLQYSSQFGSNTEGENFIIGNTVVGLFINRVMLMRFSHLEIPKNSTINSATLYLAYSHKNANTAVTGTQTVYVDSQTPTQWLDNSRKEWQGAGVAWRTWSLPAGSTSNSFGFTHPASEERTVVSHNVKPHLDALVINPGWTLAGGSATFLVSYSALSNPEYTYLSGPSDGWSPMLEINFTPPASDGKSTVVNIQENSIFTRSTNDAAAFDIAPYGFNAWFGTFVQPTYSVTSSLGTEVTVAPPTGGNMLRVQAGAGKAMVHFGVPLCEEGKWYNYSCWTWQPTTAPANMELAMNLLGDSVASGRRTEKGQWIRHDKAFMMDDAGPWAEIETSGSGFTYDSTCVFYVAGVQLTEGRMPRPWIGGNKTLAGADYGWAGIAGTNGFVRAVPPTVTVDPQTDKSIRKFYAVNWAYAQGSSHAQDSVMVKVREVR